MIDRGVVKTIFDQLYSDIDGYKVSALGRARSDSKNKTLTYGEVAPDSFFQILSSVSPQAGEVFYDLGSGTGKAVMLAGLSFPFQKVVGVEILSELSQVAQSVLIRYRSEFQKTLPQEYMKQTIDFITKDFFDVDISDADVVFAHCTCFSTELMVSLSKKLSELKVGARVITVTQQLNSPLFKLQSSRLYHMAWGNATVWVYERIVGN